MDLRSPGQDACEQVHLLHTGQNFIRPAFVVKESQLLILGRTQFGRFSALRHCLLRSGGIKVLAAYVKG